MYDVNRIEQAKDGFWVYCENDGLEEILISFLNSVKKEMEGGTTNFNLQPQFFQSVLQFTFGSYQVKLERSSTEMPVFYKSICMGVLAPPPDNFAI